jgi:hypothetical protein
MSDNRDFTNGITPQCKGCYYWRYLHSCGPAKYRPKCCHFIIEEEKLTKREGDTCYSYKPKRRVKR